MARSTDIKKLQQVAELIKQAQALLDSTSRPVRAGQPVLSYLLGQAEEQATNAYRTEYVGLYDKLPEEQAS